MSETVFSTFMSAVGVSSSLVSSPPTVAVFLISPSIFVTLTVNSLDVSSPGFISTFSHFIVVTSS